jgi:hypothetical protein
MRENPSTAGIGFVVGAFIVTVGALIWSSSKKKTAPAEATGPLPPPPPPLPTPPTSIPPAPAFCQVTADLLNQWGTFRELSVFYFPSATEPFSWDQMLQIPTLPEILALPGGLDRLVVVTQGGAFWIFTGTPPLPAAAPAARDDYCAWVGQQQGDV